MKYYDEIRNEENITVDCWKVSNFTGQREVLHTRIYQPWGIGPSILCILEKFLFQKASYKYISTKWSFQVYKHKEKYRTSGLFLTWVTVLFITFCNQEFPELPFETHHGFMVHGLKKSLSLNIRKHWIFQVFYCLRKKVWYLKCMFMVI